MKKRRIIATISNGHVTYIKRVTLKQRVLQFIYKLGEAAASALRG